MTSVKPSDNKREEFRKYLERTGVMDALTKVLVSLYEEAEKPENALDYIREKLSSDTDSDSLDTLKTKLQTANQRITELEKENSELRGEDVVPPPQEQ